MSDKETGDVSEAQIAVHWQEEEYFQPSTQFIAQANMTDAGIYDQFSLDNFPEWYKAYAVKNDAPLILGIGAGFLALASPPEVEERVKHYIEVGGKGGRLVLYLCNLGATTPPENVRAAIQAVHKYGTYNP